MILHQRRYVQFAIDNAVSLQYRKAEWLWSTLEMLWKCSAFQEIQLHTNSTRGRERASKLLLRSAIIFTWWNNVNLGHFLWRRVVKKEVVDVGRSFLFLCCSMCSCFIFLCMLVNLVLPRRAGRGLMWALMLFSCLLSILCIAFWLNDIAKRHFKTFCFLYYKNNAIENLSQLVL